MILPGEEMQQMACAWEKCLSLVVGAEGILHIQHTIAYCDPDTIVSREVCKILSSRPNLIQNLLSCTKTCCYREDILHLQGHIPSSKNMSILPGGSTCMLITFSMPGDSSVQSQQDRSSSSFAQQQSGMEGF